MANAAAQATAFVKSELLSEEDEQALQSLLDTYTMPVALNKVLPGSGARLRRTEGPPRLSHYPRLVKAVGW